MSTLEQIAETIFAPVLADIDQLWALLNSSDVSFAANVIFVLLETRVDLDLEIINNDFSVSADNFDYFTIILDQQRLSCDLLNAIGVLRQCGKTPCGNPCLLRQVIALLEKMAFDLNTSIYNLRTNEAIVLAFGELVADLDTNANPANV